MVNQYLFMNKRKILIVTERRADYSRFKPILKLLSADKRFRYDLCVTGLHLLEKHGYTLNEIKKDGFQIKYQFKMFSEDIDTTGAMVRSLSRAIYEISKVIENSKPDIILSGFDIAANLAITIAGAHMNIPVAHIQGGEVSGTIDESIRHAMSKFAHYHFASNEDACQRLIKMGEKKENVFNVGCPSIDALLSVKDDPDCLKKYNLSKPFFLVLQHPVTTEYDKSIEQMRETIKAINNLDEDILIILPNNDAGYSIMIKEINRTNHKIIDTLNLKDFVNLLKRSEGLIGNSSSGIHETNTFDIPTINIGTRQNGRQRSENIIDVPHNAKKILKAIKESKNLKNKNFKKIYGTGDASKKIIEHLNTLNLDKHIVQKKITY